MYLYAVNASFIVACCYLHFIVNNCLQVTISPFSAAISTTTGSQGAVAERVFMFEKSPPQLQREHWYRSVRPTTLSLVNAAKKEERRFVPQQPFFHHHFHQYAASADPLHQVRQSLMVCVA